MNALFDLVADPQIEPIDLPLPVSAPAHATFEAGEAERIIEAYRKAHYDERGLAHCRTLLADGLADGAAMSGSAIFATAPPEEVRELLIGRPPETWIFLNETDVDYLLALLGDGIIPRLLEIHAAQKLDPLALLKVDAPEIVLLAASRAAPGWSVESRLTYCTWLTREKERALPVLLHAVLTKQGDERTAARSGLRWLSKRDGGRAVRDLARSWNVESIEAILAPPARGFRDRAALPKSWGTIDPPVFADGSPISKDDVARLLGFLAAEPHPEHPATQRVLGAFDAGSLRTWITAMDSVWTAKGSALTHLWLLHATCLVHGDAGVRRIGTWARNKSTSSNRNERTRSGSTIAVLVELDGVTAMAQLADIAALARSEAIRQRAEAAFRIKLLETEQSPETVLDGAVPDLGLAKGVVFDYGARRFTATIDARLEIVLSDRDGARLSDLPAPRKSDDKEKAKSALREWRDFKKDAAAVLDVQRKRLEHAMISGRRMTANAFRDHVLSNPILSVLARGLVWGVWDGATARAFRVAEDLSFADARDVAIEIGDRSVSVLHPIEIEDATVWHERFQDYELIQPFEQLARAAFRVNTQPQIAECAGWIVSPGAVMGLLKEGWKPAYPVLDALTRSYGPERVVQVGVSPGFIVAEAANAPAQAFGALHVSPALLDDPRAEVIVSEILRDLARARRKGA